MMKPIWNKGIKVGPRAIYTPEEVKRIRAMLTAREDAGLRDLALFSTAIDTMLHASDLLSLTVRHIHKPNGHVRDTIEVRMAGTSRSVRCTLSKDTLSVLRAWIKKSGKKKNDYLFTGRLSEAKPVSTRQLGRLVKIWTTRIGLNATDYGSESLRRTRAVHILKKTGNLEAVRLLLGQTKIASTAAYLKEFRQADPLSISRAYEL